MVFFCDFFQLDEEILERYGAFNISLINDLPLFVDPFLLLGNTDSNYIKIHENILKYLSFLKERTENYQISSGQRKSWFIFSEVKQNWFGYSKKGNGGSGLGPKFAKAMSSNMQIIYHDLNRESITTTSHLEKICLFELGVGRDNISDFTCNLIKYFLLEYTEAFALRYLEKSQTQRINVQKVYFDYELERWMPKEYTLPYYNMDYVLLTPKNLLTKDDNWINSQELRGKFLGICNTISNDQLRSEINNFYRKQLPAPKVVGRGKNSKVKKPSAKEIAIAVNETIKYFPEIVTYFIKLKEENKAGARNLAEERVNDVITIFKENVQKLISQLTEETKFYEIPSESSYDQSMKRLLFMKDVIENKDGYKLFYHKGQPLKREADVQVIYRLTWFSSPYDVNR